MIRIDHKLQIEKMFLLFSALLEMEKTIFPAFCAKCKKFSENTLFITDLI